MSTYRVICDWDDEAEVWVATSDEVPGLVLESGSLDALSERLRFVVPELLELNGSGAGYSSISGSPLPESFKQRNMVYFEKTVRETLKDNGCWLARQGKGDHEVRFSPITNRYFTVDGKIKSRHTANAIMKQAGIDNKF